MRKRRKHIIKAAVACMALILVWNVSERPRVRALFEEGQAVHVDASEIENATLIIGTHLIHISAMNDEIYQIASDSASESGQAGQYYKSELAEGMWFDIANAFSLKDITPEGTPVEEDVIEGLFLTHHTKSDGITYDLRTGQAVCMFDISDPYDLENLSELEPLKLQYEILASKKDKNKTDEFCEENIQEFFGMDVRDEETGKLDASLQGLQGYYSSASGEKRDFAAEAMEAVDASRRSAVLGKVKEPLGQLVELLQGNNIDIEDEEGQKNYFEANGELNAGANESLGKVEDGLIQYDSMKLSEGTTVLSKEEYAVKQALADAAQTGDMAACDAAAEKGALLKNIMENSTGDAKKELEYLNGTILPAAKNAYFDLLTNGAGEEYQAAAAGNNVSQGMLNKALKSQLSKAEAAKSELQFLENAALGKMSVEEGKVFLESLLSEAEEMKRKIQEDGFSSYANESLESYASYLNTLNAQRNPTENARALSDLLEQKDKKQEEKLMALEANDLAGAKKAEAEMEELDRQTAALEKQMLESGETLPEDSGLASSSQAGGQAAEEFLDASALSEDEVKELLEEASGGEFSELGKEEQAALLLSLLESLEQSGGSGSERTAQLLAAQMEASGNPYIFQQYNDPVNEYVPVKTISECLGYRYVFDNNKKKATLTKKHGFYTFHAFELNYEKGEEGGELHANAGFQEDIYLSAQDTEELFQCGARYIPGSGLALFVTQKNTEKASEYLSMILTRLGG